MKRPVGLKKIFYLVGIWAVATISLVQLWIFVGSNIFEYFLYRNNPVIQQAREEQTLRDISFYAWGKRVLFMVIPAATIGLALTYVIAVARRKSVHTIKIANPRSNTVSEFPIDKKDLDKAVPLAMGMVNANQFEATTEGQERAQIGKYYKELTETSILLDEVDATITRRLQGQEPLEPIKVPVIDEVFVLCKRCPRAVEVILRIATESRKAGVYGLFSAQTWKADAVGGSEVRDCLMSRFAHKMQPKQANLLLRDSDQSKIVKELTTGNVLFVPVNGAVEILGIPYCDPRDMQAVYDLIAGGTPTLKPRAEQPKLHQAKRIPLPSDPDLDDFFYATGNRGSGRYRIPDRNNTTLITFKNESKT